MSSNEICFNNIEVLINKNTLFEIIPTTQMNNCRKINAIIRFALLFSILLYVFSGNYLYLYIFLVTLIVTYIVFVFGGKEYFENNECYKLSIDDENSGDEENYIDGEQSGNEENNDDIAKECIKPTSENILMNPLIGETKNNNKDSCSTDNQKIAEDIDTKFSELQPDLYHDPSTLINNRFSQRAFYSMPNTKNPSDQTLFAKWLYNTPKACAIGNNGLLKQVKSCSY